MKTILFLLASGHAVTLFAADKIPDLRPPEPILPETYWEQHPGLGILALIAIVVGSGLLLWWWLRPRAIPSIPPEVGARLALLALRNQSEDFTLVSEVNRVFRQYLAAVLSLRSPQLTTEELQVELAGHPVPGRELADSIVTFFRECDARKFAPTATPPPSPTASHALRLLAKVEARRQPLMAPDESNPAPAAAPSASA